MVDWLAGAMGVEVVVYPGALGDPGVSRAVARLHYQLNLGLGARCLGENDLVAPRLLGVVGVDQQAEQGGDNTAGPHHNGYVLAKLNERIWPRRPPLCGQTWPPLLPLHDHPGRHAVRAAFDDRQFQSVGVQQAAVTVGGVRVFADGQGDAVAGDHAENDLLCHVDYARAVVKLVDRLGQRPAVRAEKDRAVLRGDLQLIHGIGPQDRALMGDPRKLDGAPQARDIRAVVLSTGAGEGQDHGQ